MMETGAKLGVGEIISGTFEALKSNPIPYAVFALGMAILVTVGDLAPGQRGIFYGAVLEFLAGFALLRYVFAKAGMGGSRSFGASFISYLGASIMVVVGSMFGLLFLLVPGLLLAARWSIASGLIVSEDAKALDSMQRSWDLTRASQWSIFGAYAIAIIVVLLVITFAFGGLGFAQGFNVGMGQAAVETEEMSTAATFAANFATEFITVVSTAFVVFLTKRLAGASNQLQGIFS